jgi:hypothetical protein
VACFFPPTDFLNYGEKGKEALGRGTLSNFRAPFDFKELDPKTRAFVLITDEDKRRDIGRQISPIYHVTSHSAPALIIHGDADKLVPIQQAQSIVAKLKEAGVPAELVVKHGAQHGWQGMDKDLPTIADWFDKYLKKPTTAKWDDLRFLLGDWVAEGEGAPGKGSGEFSFAFDLQGKVLIRKNRAEYAAGAGQPTGVHEDLLVAYREDGKPIQAMYFDNEGHVIRYTAELSPDSRLLTLISDPAPSSPRFRLTYRKQESDSVRVAFAIAPPGKPDAFKTYVEGTAHRKKRTEAGTAQAGK